MTKNTHRGELPGWALLVSIGVPVVAAGLLGACRSFDLSLWVGVPVATVVVVVGLLWERAIERKYLSKEPRHQ